MAITSRSDLSRNSSTCLCPIYLSNRSVYKLLLLDRNTWNHISANKEMIIIKKEYLKTFNYVEIIHCKNSYMKL